MTRYHVDTDAKTGKVVTRPYTAEEEAAADLAESSKSEPAITLDEAIKRLSAIESALIEKTVLTKADIDAQSVEALEATIVARKL